MKRHLKSMVRFCLALAVQVVLVPSLAPGVAQAQPARVQRVRGPEDLVRFALDNYFHEITLDEKRRRQVGVIVRRYFAASERMKTIDEKNAALPKRRAELRAILRTEAERKQFDRNVSDRSLP